MTHWVQMILLTFIENLCCQIFRSTFVPPDAAQNKKKNILLFVIQFLGFMGIALMPSSDYILKALFSIGLISVITQLQNHGKWVVSFFLAIGYYGLLICVDAVMLAVIQKGVIPNSREILDNPFGATIIALLCKNILFLIILFINRKYKLSGSLSTISDKEWLSFLCFPVATIFCILAFAVEGRADSRAVMLTSGTLVLSNFWVYYVIGSIVKRENDIQTMKLAQEQEKNKWKLHCQMEELYEQQRRKTHEFKNHIICLTGLLKAGEYENALKYIEDMNHSYVEQIDCINTNHAVINSILNQKLKQAQSAGISMLFSLGDLKDIRMSDQDMVTLLGNLLDNAIEACEKVKEGHRVIKVMLLNREDSITIIVRNPIAQNPISDENGLLTTKANAWEHGIGMNNIQNVVDWYGGENIWSCKDGYFIHTVVIKDVCQ